MAAGAEIGRAEISLCQRQDVSRQQVQSNQHRIFKQQEHPLVWRVRRVVTGHDKNGRSCFVMDGHATYVKEMESMPGLALTDLWETTDAPASNEGNADAVTRPVPRTAKQRHDSSDRRVSSRFAMAQQRRRGKGL